MAEMNVEDLADSLIKKLPAADQLRLPYLAAKNTAEICKDIEGGNFDALVMGVFIVKNIMRSCNKLSAIRNAQRNENAG